jgi:sodium transport system permease protein
MTGRVTRQTRVVLLKELRDAFRDRRAITSVLLSVLVGPAIAGFLMFRIADRERFPDDVRVPVVGSQNAPALMDWLGQQSGVTIVPGPSEPEQAVLNEEEAVVVIVPADFVERFRSSRPARIRIVSDSSRNDVRGEVERVRRLLQQYGAQIGSLRLIARGVSPAVATPLEVTDVEVSTAQQRAARILGIVPLMILLAAFTGAMQIATDSTAGERERGSLEALLVNPVPRAALALGKCLAATLAAMLMVSLTAALCAALLRFVPLEELGIRFRFGLAHWAGMMAAALPLCFLSAALMACVATLARSFKEAQTYMGILMLAPMLLGLVGAVYPLTNQPWMYGIPILGQYVLLNGVIGGRTPVALAFLAAALGAAVAAVLCVRVMVSLFRNERVIFGR